MHDGLVHLMLSDLVEVDAVCATPAAPTDPTTPIRLVPYGGARDLTLARSAADSATRHHMSAPAEPRASDWQAYTSLAPPIV